MVSIDLSNNSGPVYPDQNRRVYFDDDNRERNIRRRDNDNPSSSTHAMDDLPSIVPSGKQDGKEKPIAHQEAQGNKMGVCKQKQFQSFKTWSGHLERQISQMVRRQQDPIQEYCPAQVTRIQALPVERYFAALEGPELDTLRVWTSVVSS